MATIQFACPQCGATAQAASFLAGQNVLCPGCGAVLIVPRESPAAAPVSNAPAPESLSDAVPWEATPRVESTSPAADAPRTAPALRPVLVETTASPGAPAFAALPAGSKIRRLTPAERAARRAHRNIILCAFGIAALMITLAVLLKLVRK